MTISGYVDQIIFRNEDNGYTVLALSSSGQDEGNEITCKGNMPGVEAGMTLECQGDYEVHPVYGTQFHVQLFEEILPQDEEGIMKYLSSGTIKGIGETIARRITAEFGADSLRVIEEEPERLETIKGISAEKARSIGVQVAEKKAARESVMLLQKYNIGGVTASRLIEKYGAELKTVLITDPWRMAGEVEGVGFRTADAIAKRTGVQMDSASRIKSGILYTLSEALREGHCLIKKDEMLSKAGDLLACGEGESISPGELQNCADELTISGSIVVKRRGNDNLVWLKSAYMAEQECARRLRQLSGAVDKLDMPDWGSEDEFSQLDQEQRNAVQNVMERGVNIITGGPGTGKTTTIKAIVAAMASHGAKTVLAAPTGRAAKRMEQASGMAASTIHRLLEVQAQSIDDPGKRMSGAPVFQRNEENPLEADCIIVDEAGMLDIFLMRDLLRAIPEGSRLVISGDRDQLPSVGPGQVLRDIISSGVFPVSSLSTIHRQDDGSGIVDAAHRINKGLLPDLSNKGKDFFFMPRDDYRVIYKHMVEMITDKLPAYLNVTSGDIQVLTPMKKGPLGSVELSAVLQRMLNPPSPEKEEIERNGSLLREGDRVMQIRNDYSIEWEVVGKYNVVVDSGTGIYNGDIGIIREIDRVTGVVTVEFDEGRRVRYEKENLSNIELAYALTVHKSQGSEYPAVIIPVMPGPAPLMNRNLIYTAVTRAQRMVVMMGKKNTLEQMIENDRPALRNTGLSDALSVEIPI
ncbi:MAG: ATP-dependent RecD-like DNA helicase [Lachnospiraceae bacterium]|nr:ATP-dependent RecD-like DNA helicase [Lachnospiraceae bacterium]